MRPVVETIDAEADLAQPGLGDDRQSWPHGAELVRRWRGVEENPAGVGRHGSFFVLRDVDDPPLAVGFLQPAVPDHFAWGLGIVQHLHRHVVEPHCPDL